MPTSKACSCMVSLARSRSLAITTLTTRSMAFLGRRASDEMISSQNSSRVVASEQSRIVLDKPKVFEHIYSDQVSLLSMDIISHGKSYQGQFFGNVVDVFMCYVDPTVFASCKTQKQGHFQVGQVQGQSAESLRVVHGCSAEASNMSVGCILKEGEAH